MTADGSPPAGADGTRSGTGSTGTGTGASVPGTGASASRPDASALLDWLRTTDWLWTIIGGFYQIGYLFWYVPALAALPGSLRDPPEQFPWHWPLDFVATALSGAVLLFLGFRRATDFAEDSDGGSQDGDPRDRSSQDGGSRGVATSPGGDSGAE